MRSFLIHLLGGYLKDELQQESESKKKDDLFANVYELGYNECRRTIEQYMRDINGECAESWCEAVWKFVAFTMNPRYKKEKE